MDEALQKAGVESLSAWALRLNYETGRALMHPMAAMMPVQVRRLFCEQAAIIALMARRLDGLGEGVKNG